MTELAAAPEAEKVEATSEAEALANILAWSQDCPRWQRDALRRLCEKDELDNKDLDELTALCRSQGKGGVPRYMLACCHGPFGCMLACLHAHMTSRNMRLAVLLEQVIERFRHQRLNGGLFDGCHHLELS